MKRQTYIVVSAVFILIAIVLAWQFFGDGDGGGFTEKQVVAEGDPIDVTLDFYSPWFAAVRATSTDPYQEGLAEAPILSPALRTQISEAGEGEDPVLCQTDFPTEDVNVAARPIFENDTEAQVMVQLRGTESPNQSVVTLNKQDNGWYINTIECSAGETAPEREFDFDRQGFLLKDVPEPLDSQYWHLVFEQDGVQGHTVPLFFDEESVCVAVDGTEATCNPDSFTPAAKAHVKAQMTEAGAEVKRVEMMEKE